MKSVSIFCIASFFYCTASSQTLFTYGTTAVDKEEFLKAYNKNKTATSNKEQALREYLDLYSKFKLKVKAARDLRLDSLPQLKSDLENFRSQIEENYLNNDNYMNQLIDEAADHAVKDLHVMHIFVPAKEGISAADSVKAANAAQELYSKLAAGEKDADKLVQDITAKTAPARMSDLGYVTAFALPYEYEKIIYATKPGAVSKPYHSKKGWHIFKVLDERKNPGRWRAAQILLSISPGDNNSNNFKEQQQKADSVYKLLKGGADFIEMAKLFSEDRLTYMAGGELQEFTSGRYEPDFEKEVFKLGKDGDYTKPFLTSYGFHIVKRLSVRPNPADKTDPSFRYDMRQKVLQDSRVNAAKESFNQGILKQVAFKRNAAVKDADLFRWADSVVTNPVAFETGRFPVANTAIYSFGKNSLKFNDWLRFIREFKPNPELYHGESNAELLQKFITVKSLEYYRSHLEEYSAEFRSQVDEFKEGNLLFEVMERKVWSSAANDTAGLRKYYNEHKDRYIWAASADVLVFSAGNKKAADEAITALQKNNDWKKIAEESNGVIQSDSGRYEMAQLALQPGVTAAPGLVTPVMVNTVDGTAGFLKILRVHPAGTQRSFDEARGLVINDYQNVVEEKWIEELKKKYPVKVDEAVFKSLLK